MRRWTSLPFAKKACQELCSCNRCKSYKGTCRCFRAELECPCLCKCDGNCDGEPWFCSWIFISILLWLAAIWPYFILWCHLIARCQKRWFKFGILFPSYLHYDILKEFFKLWWSSWNSIWPPSALILWWYHLITRANNNEIWYLVSIITRLWQLKKGLNCGVNLEIQYGGHLTCFLMMIMMLPAKWCSYEGTD